MSNQELHTATVIIGSYDQFDVNGKKKFVLKTTDGQYDLWETNRDGSQSKAYIDFCNLGSLNVQAQIGYVIMQNGQYINNVVRFIKKIGGNAVKKTEESTLEQRITSLESRVAQLMSKQPTVTTVDKLATEFGGTVVSQTPVPEQGSTNVSTPVNPDEPGIDVSKIPF